MDPFVDELSATTKYEIYPGVIKDNFFLDTPLLAYFRDHSLVPFPGGTAMQQTFLFKNMATGSYAIGQNLNTNKRKTIAATRFEPKFYASIIPEYMEDIDVFNVGPDAVFSLLQTDLANAMNSICANIAVALSLHGQASASGIVGNRPYDISGWIEAINDGITPGWDGSIFTTYGGQSRNGAIGSTMNSIPRYCGDSTPATGTSLGGPVTYSILEEGYWDATVGRERPNLGTCNKALYAYIKERIQPLQRANMENAVDAVWGVSGVKMNDAMILPDEYFPSAVYGQNYPDFGNNLTGTFTVPAGASSLSHLPASGVTVTVGEVFAWLTTNTWLFRVATSPRYNFGLQGFFPQADGTKVVARIHAGIQTICTAPRQQKQFYGITA